MNTSMLRPSARHSRGSAEGVLVGPGGGTRIQKPQHRSRGGPYPYVQIRNFPNGGRGSFKSPPKATDSFERSNSHGERIVVISWLSFHVYCFLSCSLSPLGSKPLDQHIVWLCLHLPGGAGSSCLGHWEGVGGVKPGYPM